MENNAYNSLAEKLMQSGIIKSEEKEELNFFESSQTVPILQNKEKELSENKKRINRYDLEIIQKDNISSAINFKTVALLKILKRIIDFKKRKKKQSEVKLENLFFKFFPRLYKAKLVKDALTQLLELNVDAKTLLDKTIPYGEADIRYKDLVKYLNYANEIQTNLKKKF